MSRPGFFGARLNYGRFVERALRKVFPDHWSYLLGEVALFALLILVGTGIFLGLFYEAGLEPTVYAGGYLPMRGEVLPRAYASTLALTHDVALGDLARRVHHFAAHLFIGAIVLHAARVFFGGAFRRPRELNWVIGVALLLLAVLAGFSGYCLPYDQRGGTALRMAYTQAETLPWIGHRVVTLLGDEFPASLLLERMLLAHVLVIPALIALALGAHVLLVVLQTHTQRSRLRPAATHVVGSPLWPEQAARTAATLLVTTGVIFLLAALFPGAATWVDGPFTPERQRGMLEPDWFFYYSEGAYRLLPPIEWRLLGTRITGPFVGGALLTAAIFAVTAVVPWLDAAVYGWGGVDHHEEERARDRPLRAAFGVMGLTFLVLLSCGVLDERLAGTGPALYAFRRVLGWMVVLVPPAAFLAVFLVLRGRSAGVHRRRRPPGRGRARRRAGSSSR